MVEKGILRRAFNSEKSRIIEHISNFTHNINNLSKKHKFNFYILQDNNIEDRNHVLLIDDINSRFLERNNPIFYVFYAGLYFGSFKKKRFSLSLEGSEWLYLNHYFNEEYRVKVNKEGEKAILYGNDLIKKMVFEFSEKIRSNRFILILNSYNELIATGMTTVNFSRIQNSDQIIAKTLADKGYYLRIEQ